MKLAKKVAIVYHYVAHYRRGIFRELTNDSLVEYTIISAKESGNNIQTLSPKLALKPLDQGGFRWLFVNNHWFLNNRFLWQKGLISHLLKQNFDTVILLGNIYYLSTWVALIYLKLKNKKVLLWTHGVTSDTTDFKWTIRKYFYNLSDGLLLYGNNAKKVMIRNGFPEKKLHVIYNSLDYNGQLKYRNIINSNTIIQTRKELFNNSELPVIIFVGRLTLHKKLDMIIDAVKLLHDKNIKINTLFIGEGEAKPNLQELIDKNGLKEHFNFWGSCYDEYELSRLISSADICVSPGEVGLTAITSLGYGTPVITHGDFNNQMPEYEAITPGINGEFFKRDSIEDLANKIQQWIENNKGKSRDKIRRDCFEIIDLKYNPKNQAKLINEIIFDS